MLYDQGEMRAVQLRRWEADPELVEVGEPEPGPGEVLVEVEAAGLCHSDLHLMHDWPAGTVPYELPFTLGHENAGTVAALGPGSGGVEVGERVVVHARWGCGRCRFCLQGMDNVCQAPAGEIGFHGGGVGRDGGLARFMVVPSSRYLVPIGDLDPAVAAPLTDAALTPYHAIQRSRHQLRPDGAVVVIGVGGIGHIALQILRAVSEVPVVAIDAREEAVRLALDAGATVALRASEPDPARVRDELGGRGATLVLDCVAADATLGLAAAVLAPGGDLSYVGRGGGTLPVRPGAIPFEASVVVPTWGSIAELIEVVALARAGAIHAEVERLRLDQAIDGYRRLEAGEIVGRAVVDPRR
jgi:propanol-preferring alcohol dehydrogenase